MKHKHEILYNIVMWPALVAFILFGLATASIGTLIEMIMDKSSLN